MDAGAHSRDCPGCGAPLPPSGGRAEIQCSYCGRTLAIEQTADTDLARIRRGEIDREIGVGRRWRAGQIDWRDTEHSLWPVAARASSSFGGGWSPRALCGPPLVFPASGDRRGAWAPRKARSDVEWVEVDFDDAFPVRAIRVFETHVAGSTFAITLVDDGRETLLWQRPPEDVDADAHMLEVKIDPPRRVGSARAYVNNDGSSGWAEIDTIGLLSVEPLPLSKRAKPAWRFGFGKLVLAFAVLGMVVTGVLASGAFDTARASRRPTPEAPSERVAGTSLMRWTVDRTGMAQLGTVWASSLAGYSSQYSDTMNAANHVLGAPDVFPAYGDAPNAWAPSAQNDGLEHVDVRFSAPVHASAVVIVQTFHPGALARVEDISAGRPPAVLWEGVIESAADSRVNTVELSTPREIRSGPRGAGHLSCRRLERDRRHRLGARRGLNGTAPFWRRAP